MARRRPGASDLTSRVELNAVLELAARHDWARLQHRRGRCAAEGDQSRRRTQPFWPWGRLARNTASPA
jgi:hypothetical protein